MKEISLHILDIVQNSITAGASLIEVCLDIDSSEDKITISIRDNGRGMDEQMLHAVESPFTTTRTTRKVGLGIPLFAAGAEASGGSFDIDSIKGVGTTIKAVYRLDNIDRPPIGDFAGTMHTLIVCNPSLDFVVEVVVDSESQKLDTREIREVLGSEIALDTPDVSSWLKENLDEMFQPKFAAL